MLSFQTLMWQFLELRTRLNGHAVLLTWSLIIEFYWPLNEIQCSVHLSPWALGNNCSLKLQIKGFAAGPAWLSLTVIHESSITHLPKYRDTHTDAFKQPFIYYIPLAQLGTDISVHWPLMRSIYGCQYLSIHENLMADPNGLWSQVYCVCSE